tara:strand:- start:46365 stop:47063 length:699 start_codon:yes stop_codon:yes gene_type:complete
MVSIIKNFTAMLGLLLFTGTSLCGQETKNDIKRLVQVKMIQAQRLYVEGNRTQSMELIKESIAMIRTAIRNGPTQSWMRDGLEIALRAASTDPDEIARVMKEADLYININKTVQTIQNELNSTPQKETISRSALLRQLNGLEYSRASRDFALDRHRAALGGAFLGQRHPSVGYRPIISFIPQGNMMVAGPVIVSPDRRYVRVGISASNIGIGNVHTFNFSTGESLLIEKRRK